MNFFKACFSSNTRGDIDFDQYEKNESPHQKLQRKNVDENEIEEKQSNIVANILEVRGAWKHRGEQVDYSSAGHKQEKYQQFLEKKRNKMSQWNSIFEEEYR